MSQPPSGSRLIRPAFSARRTAVSLTPSCRASSRLLLVGASMRRSTVKGFPRASWEKEPGRRNEALDCRVYARAAAAICGIDRWPDARWRELERYLGREERPVPAPTELPPEPKPAPARCRQLGWLPNQREDWLSRGRYRSWWDR
jgi:Phage terminase large subunit (GpA)